jgi:hypothetical protein
MKFYEEYQRELEEEIKARTLTSEELDDVSGFGKPSPMSPESVTEAIKGNKFRFSLGSNGNHNYSDYLIEARKISEWILKRSSVNLERGLATIVKHLTDVNEPQYSSVFLMRLY